MKSRFNILEFLLAVFIYVVLVSGGLALVNNLWPSAQSQNADVSRAYYDINPKTQYDANPASSYHTYPAQVIEPVPEHVITPGPTKVVAPNQYPQSTNQSPSPSQSVPKSTNQYPVPVYTPTQIMPVINPPSGNANAPNSNDKAAGQASPQTSPANDSSLS